MAEELAELLAQSPLPEGIRLGIIASLGEMPEEKIMELMQALRTGGDHLNRIVSELQSFYTKREEDWQQIRRDQTVDAEKLEQEITDELLKEVSPEGASQG